MWAFSWTNRFVHTRRTPLHVVSATSHACWGMTCVLSLLAADGVRLEAHRPSFWADCLQISIHSSWYLFVVGWEGTHVSAGCFSCCGQSRLCPQIAASGFCFVANCFPATSADYHLQPSTLYGPADTFLAFFGSGCIIGTTAFIVTCFTSHVLRHMFTWLLPLQK